MFFSCLFFFAAFFSFQFYNIQIPPEIMTKDERQNDKPPKQNSQKNGKKNQDYYNQTTTNDPNFYCTEEPYVNSYQTQPGHTNKPTQEPCLTTQEFKNSIIQMKQVIEDILIKTITQDIKEEKTNLQQEEKKYGKQKSKKKNNQNIIVSNNLI